MINRSRSDTRLFAPDIAPAGGSAGGSSGAAAGVAAGGSAAAQSQRRFRLLPFNEMSPEQRKYADALRAGPAAAAGSAALTGGADSIGAPFNVWLRSPILAEHLRHVSEYIRFKSSIPTRLNEFAILVTARQWNAQYEWLAHHRLALKAGLNPAIAEELARGLRPAAMDDDEAAVYDFSHELHTTKAVSDATYRKIVDRFGEQGAVDLIAVNGYYVMVAMILGVDRTPMPGGVPPPLQPLA